MYIAMSIAKVKMWCSQMLWCNQIWHHCDTKGKKYKQKYMTTSGSNSLQGLIKNEMLLRIKESKSVPFKGIEKQLDGMSCTIASNIDTSTTTQNKLYHW